MRNITVPGFDLFHYCIRLSVIMKIRLTIITLSVALMATLVSGCVFSASSGSASQSPTPSTNASPSGAPEAGSAETKAAPPETLVAELYKAHDGKKSPFFQTKDRSLVDKYFTKSLADLIWKDANESKGEVGAISADPLYNAQDVEIKNFAVGKGDIKGEAANVAVTFTNFGEKQTVNFALKLTGGIWKIENIAYGSGDSLMKWLKETYSTKTESPSVTSGEFEGKYKVGETTCTVRPVKMSFEVRWAKGSGVEYFAFTEGKTFESAPDQPDSNKFVFDDDNYNTGTFYRADGKSFAVKRAR